MYRGSPKHKADKARWQREWRKKNRAATRELWKNWELRTNWDSKDSQRRNHLRVEYGITLEDFEDMYAAQCGLCAVCGLPEPVPLVVDHDHVTGRVRGLVHRTCNSGMGLLHDDPVLLRQAADYLDKHTNAQRDSGKTSTGGSTTTTTSPKREN